MTPFCECDCLLFDILELSLEFDLCLFSHISRMTNVLAHNIVKVHCEVGEHRIWKNGLPPFIRNHDILST